MHGRTGSHPDHYLRRSFAHGARHPQDLGRGNQGFLFAPGSGLSFELQVPPLHQAIGFLLHEGSFIHCLPGHKKVLAVLEVAHKLTVPQTFCQQYMGDCARQCAIGARVDRQPFVRLGGNVGKARVHCYYCAAFHDVGESIHHVGDHAVRCQWVATPGHQAIGLFQVVVAVPEETLGQPGAHFFRFSADGAVREVVGRSKYLGQGTIQEFGRGGGIASTHVNQLVGFIGLAQLDHLVGDRVECFVPTDGHKLRIDTTALLRVGPLHRYLDAVGVVHLLRNHVATRADIAVV